jgi:hypothetical protein
MKSSNIPPDRGHRAFWMARLRRAGRCFAIFCAILGCAGSTGAQDSAGDEPGGTTSPAPTSAAPQWVRIEGRGLVAGGQPVRLRGIGLGNWILVEHFMIGLPQVDYVMRETFAKVLGPEKSAAFWDAYMKNYFAEKDVARIRELGFNHVRLPWNRRAGGLQAWGRGAHA